MRPVLSADVAVFHDVAVVSLFGELDMSAAGLVRRCVDDALRLARRAVVLDVSRLRFVDVEGARALRQTANTAEAAGLPMLLASPSLNLTRLLRLTALAAEIPVCESVRAALASYRTEATAPLLSVVRGGRVGAAPPPAWSPVARVWSSRS